MGFIKEFKAFAITGNLLELAVAVIIGGAVGKIISSLVDHILMPIIGTLIGENFSGLAVVINGATIKYGIFIQNIINFLIIAFVLFLLIKGANQLKKKEPVKEVVPTGPTQEELLTQIRDLLKK